MSGTALGHLKKFATLTLPPGAIAAVKMLRDKARDMKLFGFGWEWETAPDTDATWSTREGWSHQSIADVQRRKWSDFLASVEGAQPIGHSHEAYGDTPPDVGVHNTVLTFAYVLGRVGGQAGRVSVLDWGGGTGHYYVYARKLLPEISLEYVVKDLSALCHLGKELLPDVAFTFDDVEALSRKYDLVFASSSIHYTHDCYRLLAQLCDSATKWLMVTRLPVVLDAEDFVVVQRPHSAGYLTEYPCWFLNRQRLVEFISAKGFTLDREFLVNEKPYVRNASEQASYRGFLFQRRSLENAS